MLRINIVISMLLLPLFAESKVVFTISDQNSLSLLQKEINSTISSGETDIVVRFTAGTFVFKEKQIKLENVNNPNLKIQIVGDNAVFIPDGTDYIKQDKKVDLNIYHGWLDGKNDIPIWSDMKQTNQLIEVVDLEKKLCRLKSSKTLNDSNGEYQYILITQWYKSNTYPIMKTEDNYIYFTASDLTNSSYKKTEYSINDDFNYYGKYPRYKLCNVKEEDNYQSLIVLNGELEMPNGVSKVRECKVSTFLYIENCTLSQFKMEGFEFWGSAYGYPDSFITMKNIKAKSISVMNCSFYGTHNNIISILNSDNVTIANNIFKTFYYTGVQSDNRSSNTRIINNSFVNAGLGLSNTFCIFCCGKDYYIRGNRLENYGYGGIRVGLWYLNKQYGKSNGVVEDNTLIFTDGYNNTISDNGLMDGGAIYISTINDKAIVRNNYINGFSGAGGNRGIFCDDGAMGYEIYGNVILNISRRDYCIASRREPSVENRNDSRSSVQKANVNNIIRDNILDGKILFKGHESLNNGCRKGVNYILLLPDEEGPQNAISHIWRAAKDIVIEYRGVKDNKFLVSKSDYKKIEKSKEWNYLKRYVKAISDRK